MKIQVSEQTVQDMLDRIPWATCRIRAVLEIVAAIMPQLQAGDEQAAIKRAVVIATGRDDFDAELWSPDTIRRQVRSCIRELDNHVDKAAVVAAALAKLSDVEGKESNLEDLLPAVKRAFIHLDPRTREVLTVFRELQSVSCRIDTDYCNELLETFTADVSILRSEPDLTAMIRAYDMAQVINKTL